MTEILQAIDEAMESLGLPYAFMMFNKSPLPSPYFVGEYTEIAGTTEDGLRECTFMLTGYTRGTWIELEQAREKIEKHFSRAYGYTAVTESGTGLAISYANTLIVPTGDAEVKRIQVNLNVKEWKVN